MTSNLDDQIQALSAHIQAGLMSAARIEENHARRAAQLPPPASSTDRTRARCRAYDAAKRAKIERARVSHLIERRAQLIAQRDALEAVAALL